MFHAASSNVGGRGPELVFRARIAIIIRTGKSAFIIRLVASIRGRIVVGGSEVVFVVIFLKLGFELFLLTFFLLGLLLGLSAYVANAQLLLHAIVQGELWFGGDRFVNPRIGFIMRAAKLVK
jgi:hypothetical protein